jgi:hypothetical protein
VVTQLWNRARRRCKHFCLDCLEVILLTLHTRRHHIQIPSFSFSPSNKFRRDHTSYPTTPMVPIEVSKPAEVMASNIWSTPPQENLLRPRPVTLHEAGFSYCMPDEYNSLPAWDSSTMPMQPAHGLPQTYSVQQDFYPTSGVSTSTFQLSALIR